MEAKLIKKSENYYELYEVRTNLTLLIGSTDSERKIDVYGKDAHKLLSLKNCQAIENGYDLDELASSLVDRETNASVDSSYRKTLEKYVKIGLQNSLEILGDKKFSEEDILDAWEDGATKKHPLTKEKKENLLKSLQQTEWDCIIEMECVMGCKNLILNGENSVCCGDKKPKFDADGNLILKRK